MTQVSRADYLGTMRFWRSSDDVRVSLFDAGALKTGIVLGTAGASAANLHIIAPDGTLKTFNGAGTEPADVWAQTSKPGVYRVRLYGSGATQAADKLPLAQIGNYGLLVEPAGTTTFDPVAAQYEVRPDFDLRFAGTYVPGSGGTDKFKASLAIFRWWSHEVLNPTDVDLTAVSINLRDRSGTSFVSAVLGDAVINNNALFFDKAITGLTGGDVLEADVQVTWKAVTHRQFFPLVSRFGA